MTEVTDEIKKEVEHLFERAKRIPELKIIEKRLPFETVLKGTFDEEDLEVRPGSSKENWIEIKIHNDRWYLPDQYMPVNGTKIITYRVIREPLGLISIEVIAGNQYRNQDYRRERLENPLKQTFHFVCVEGENPYYQQYKDLKGVPEDKLTDNQKIAVERKKEAQYVINLLQPYIMRYVFVVREDILKGKEISGNKRLKSPFSYSSGDTAKNFWRYIRELETFIEETTFYLKCMLILNQLDLAEYNELEIRLERAKFYLLAAKQTLSYKFEQIEKGENEQFILGTNNDDKDPRFTEEENEKYYGTKGPVQRAIQYIEWLLKEREERVQDIIKRPGKAVMDGYIHIDAEGRLYPNLTEIERRKNLYKMYGDSSTEQEIQQIIREKMGINKSN